MARFDYYDRLNRTDKATYRKSDAVAALPLENLDALRPLAAAIEPGLTSENRPAVQRACVALVDALVDELEIGPVAVEVLARRPSNDTSELHGLYTRDEEGRARIQVWMRTAAHQRPVAFRTFVRTLLHEVCHHIDFEKLELRDSFHTEGFYRRESSLARQLLGEGRRTASRTSPLQGDLFDRKDAKR